MNNFIKQIIEEKFVSKKQQKYFYSKANDKSLSKEEREKWGKKAKEFSSKTDFKKLPNKVKGKEEEVDEIVDDKGNIARSKRPTDLSTKGTTDKWTTDQVVKTATGSQGIYGINGTRTRRTYWLEGDMSKSLGYEDTLGQDAGIEQAEDHFENELGLSPEETKDRLEKIGYDENLPDDKVRLVENPRKFMEEYIESILNRKTDNNDIIPKEEEQMEEKEINPIVIKQLNSLKNSMNSHNLSINDIIKHLNK